MSTLHLKQFQNGLDQRDKEYEQRSRRRISAYSDAPFTSSEVPTVTRYSSDQPPVRRYSHDSIYSIPYTPTRMRTYPDDCVIDEFDCLDKDDRYKYESAWLKCINHYFINLPEFHHEEIPRDAYTDAWLKYFGYESTKGDSASLIQTSVVADTSTREQHQEDVQDSLVDVSGSSGSSHRTYTTPAEYMVSSVDSIIGATEAENIEYDDGQSADTWVEQHFPSPQQGVVSSSSAHLQSIFSSVVFSDINESLQGNASSSPVSQENVGKADGTTDNNWLPEDTSNSYAAPLPENVTDDSGGDNNDNWLKDNPPPLSRQENIIGSDSGICDRNWVQDVGSSSSVVLQESIVVDSGGGSKSWKLTIATIASSTPQDWKAFAEQNDKSAPSNTHEETPALVPTNQNNIVDVGEGSTQQEVVNDAPVAFQDEKEEEEEEENCRIKYTHSDMVAVLERVRGRSYNQVAILAGRLINALNITDTDQKNGGRGNTASATSEKTIEMPVCHPIREPNCSKRDMKGFNPGVPIMQVNGFDSERRLFIKSRLISRGETRL